VTKPSDVSNVFSLRPAESSVSLRCQAALGYRLAKDAARLGFSELAERARVKAREMDAEAVRAAMYEAAEKEREALHTGALAVLSRVARRRAARVIESALERVEEGSESA
jgi:hypothetical protein